MKVEPFKRPRLRNRDADVRKLKRRFRTFSRKHSPDQRLPLLKALPWHTLAGAFALGALATWTFHAWVWNSNLWPSTQVLLEVRPVHDCATARRIGAAPLYKGFSGYREWLDADRDGIACEPLGL